MSNHSELAVYRAAYSLLEELSKCVKNMNRNFKFSLGDRMMNSGINSISEIASANRTKSMTERTHHISSVVSTMEDMQVMVRLARDLQVLQTSHYSKIVEMIDDVLTQSKKWKKFTERNASSSQK